MDPRALRDVYDAQGGVVTRRQLLRLGVDDNAIRRMARRRELVRVHPGVYVNHTGPLTWANRAWAAVLFYWPAALCGRSALDLSGDPLHVAIEHPRNATRLPGVRLHRLTGLSSRVRWNLNPPRLRVEEAALDVAAQSDSLSGAVAVLTSVCQRRMTRPDRLLEALEARARISRSADLRAVLADVSEGANSVLERGYLRRVELPHGLPRGKRQARAETGGGSVYRDVLYEDFGVVVELDGWQWHGTSEARWRDMSRDLQAATEGLVTLRLGWTHVHDQACETADRLGRVLGTRGWSGKIRACGRCALSGRSRSRGA